MAKADQEDSPEKATIRQASAANQQTCRKCLRVQPLTEFGWKLSPKGARPGRRKTYCKICSRQISADHYAKNKQRYLDRNKKNSRAFIAKRFAWYLEQKQGRTCANCGTADIAVLEFHHLDPAIKVDAVSNLVNAQRPKKMILAEIAKCNTLCGNCHLLETIVEQKTWRSKPPPTDIFINQLIVDMKKTPLASSGEAREHVAANFKPCSECVSAAAPCRACRSRISKKVYARRARTRFPLRDQIASARSKKIVYEFFSKQGCKDCHADDWRVMQFDHVRGVKEFDIGNVIGKAFSPKRLKSEIAKCEVVCVDCHKRRTTTAHRERKLKKKR